MSSFSVMSGINGVVGEVPDGSAATTAVINAIGKWDLNPKSEASEYASSATSQAMDRVAGNDDWDGNYGAYGDAPSFLPGDFLMLYGFMNATQFVSGRGIVDEVSLKLDIEGAKEIEHSVKISCAYDGVSAHALNDAGIQGALYDASPMNVQSAAGCPVGICYPGQATWYALKDVRSVDLSLKTANKNYHSSTTAYLDTSRGATVLTGAVWRNWCGRVRGNLDCTVNISQYGTPDQLPPPKSIWGIRIYTQRYGGTISNAPGWLDNGGNFTNIGGGGAGGLGGPGVAVTGVLTDGGSERYWEIKWVIFQGHSGIEVDRKSTNIIGASSNGGFKSVVNVGNVYGVGSGTATLGSIAKPPGGVAWQTASYWPWSVGRT